MSRMNRWQITKIAIKKDSKRLQDTPPKKIPTSQFLMLFMDTILLACLRWQLEKKHDELHELIISTGSTVDRKKRLHQLRLRLVALSPLFTRFLYIPRWLFEISSINCRGFYGSINICWIYPPRCQSPTGVSTRSSTRPRHHLPSSTHLRGPCVAFTLLMKPLCLRSAALPRLPRAWNDDQGKGHHRGPGWRWRTQQNTKLLAVDM